MELGDVKTFFEENKDNEEVKDFAKSFAPEFDVNQVMENEEVKKQLASMMSIEGRRQVDAYRENSLPEAIQKGVEKALLEKEEAAKNKTPEQLKIEELDKRLSESDARVAAAELGKILVENKNSALKILSEKKLPVKMVDMMINEDETKTLENVNLFTEMMDEFTAQVKQGVIKAGNIDAADSDSDASDDSNLNSKQIMDKHYESINQ